MKIKLFIAMCLLSLCYQKANIFAQDRTIGTVFIDQEKVAEDYLLLAPINSKSTYLLNNCGEVVHEWKSDFVPGNEVQLLENGNLLRTGKLPDTRLSSGGAGGRIEILDQGSNIVWSSNFISDTARHHHDVLQLPNGNLVFQIWDQKTKKEAVDNGRDVRLFPEDSVIWSEKIMEIKPIGTDSFEVVWEWSLWDHLIQDYDVEKSNFGNVSSNYSRIDINYVTTPDRKSWVHINGLSYNEDLDHLMLSSRTFGEVWIIDHSTTTLEAAGSTGGTSGKGGGLLYRFGNPQAYKAGSASEQVLFGQHFPHWTNTGNATNEMIVFNNGWNSIEDVSKVQIFELPLQQDNTYAMVGDVFTESMLIREIASLDTSYFKYSNFISGAEQLDNGHILICSGPFGTIAEIDSLDNLVWAYVNPTTSGGEAVMQGIDPTSLSNPLFRAHKYGSDYGGIRSLMNRLESNVFFPIELDPLESLCFEEPLEVKSYMAENFTIYPNPTKDILNIEMHISTGISSITIIDITGKVVFKADGILSEINLMKLPQGLYRLNLFNENSVLIFSQSIIKE